MTQVFATGLHTNWTIVYVEWEDTSTLFRLRVVNPHRQMIYSFFAKKKSHHVFSDTPA